MTDLPELKGHFINDKNQRKFFSPKNLAKKGLWKEKIEKKITLKEFKVFLYYNGPKRNAADITVKSALICTHQP